MEVDSLSKRLDKLIVEGEELSLPTRTVTYDSSFERFEAFEGQLVYPTKLQEALVNLYREYNGAFTRIVNQHREFETDYRFANSGIGGGANNMAVQIDMQGLPSEFLELAKHKTVEELTEELRNRVFEIENSIAMTNLLQQIGGVNDSSHFESGWRLTLDQVREKHGKEVALLAVTDAKFNAILATELGLTSRYDVNDALVRSRLGYDRFMSPSDLVTYFNSLNGRESDYLFFVRSSDPVNTLKDPSNSVQTILDEDDLRRFIREFALTYNIDNPSITESRINDTKAYLAKIGMAYDVHDISDLDSEDFTEFLQRRGVDTTTHFKLRGKPYSGTYGCYGHVRGNATSKKHFLRPLQEEIKRRGPYVIQPELPQASFHNTVNGLDYNYIHRIFIGTSDGDNFNFIGGFANCLESENMEAKKGRIHGNSSAVWREIISQ